MRAGSAGFLVAMKASWGLDVFLQCKPFYENSSQVRSYLV